MDTQQLMDAPMYEVLRGPVSGLILEDEEWDMFDIESGDGPSKEVLEEAARRNIRLATGDKWGAEHATLSPQKDDIICRAGADDLDAAIAFLHQGGILVKLPDSPTSEYWRLYAVLMVKRTGDEDKEYPWQTDVPPVRTVVTLRGVNRFGETVVENLEITEQTTAFVEALRAITGRSTLRYSQKK